MILSIRKVRYRDILWNIEEETDESYLLLYGDCQWWISKEFTGEIEIKTITLIP